MDVPTDWTVFSVRNEILMIAKSLDPRYDVDERIEIDKLIAKLHDFSAQYPGRPDPDDCADVDKEVPISQDVAQDYINKAEAICNKAKV